MLVIELTSNLLVKFSSLPLPRNLSEPRRLRINECKLFNRSFLLSPRPKQLTGKQ